MKNNGLVEKMAKLGFPLFEVEKDEDVNKVLYEVLKSGQTRFLEGFPILLANAAQEGGFDYRRILNLCKNQGEKKKFLDFILLALAVYEYFRLRFWWMNKLKKNFSKSEKKKIYVFLDLLRKKSNLKVSDYSFHTERIKTIFENYSEERKMEQKKLSEKYEGLSLEYALSQVFSPKQKHLFFKRLRGEKMTKTEREYYSRVVKKKALALANSELNKLAREIVES